MAPHSTTFAWKIPWMEESGRLQSMGSLELDTSEWLHFHLSLSSIGEGNGNPHQGSCLENPRDGEAWWAVIYGVAQRWTRLKRLSSSSSMLILLCLDESCFSDWEMCQKRRQVLLAMSVWNSAPAVRNWGLGMRSAGGLPFLEWNHIPRWGTKWKESPASLAAHAWLVLYFKQMLVPPVSGHTFRMTCQ